MDIQKMRRLEKDVGELGFMFANPKNGYYHSQLGDVVALIPKDKDSVPVYARDAEVFVGSLEELNIWLRGVEWARQYDMLLKVSDDKKRGRKEQDERNKQMVQRLKDETLTLRKK
jgi:hypothetical protein